MTILLETVGALFVAVGVLFNALGVIGILRLPDTYSRLHATGKTGTLGVVMICVGVACIMPATALKAIALIVFMIFSNPLTSHAVATAVNRSGFREAEAQPATFSRTQDMSAVQQADEQAQAEKS